MLDTPSFISAERGFTSAWLVCKSSQSGSCAENSSVCRCGTSGLNRFWKPGRGQNGYLEDPLQSRAVRKERSRPQILMP